MNLDNREVGLRDVKASDDERNTGGVRKSAGDRASLQDYEEIFGAPKSRETVMKEIREDPEMYLLYGELPEERQEELVAFCMGVRGLRMMYDGMFKAILDPDLYPERLEDLISQLLGSPVKIQQKISGESQRLAEEGSIIVMDVVVKLESGVLVNVEIQRLGYRFPGQRSACYSSDLMMRQYSQAKSRSRRDGKTFSYHELKRVYTIILIQNSTKDFSRMPDQYLHHFRQRSDTGFEMDLLQEYLLVPLDIFRKNPHNEISRLDAWLYFLASDEPEDILRVIESYPEFREIYRDVFQFRYQKGELMGIFSEALHIMDVNMTHYMIEEQKRELEEVQKEKAEALEDIRKVLKDKDTAVRDRDTAVRDRDEAVKNKEKAEIRCRELEAEIRHLKKELGERGGRVRRDGR